MYHAGLVLEGGGMRGIYTAGVLEYLLEKDVMFANCYGVSAGACHLVSYLSKQKGRAYRISVNYLNDRNYCSVSSLLRTGDIFNVDMCYHKIPDELDLYDYDTFSRYEGNAYAVATNLETGKAEYFPLKDLRTDIEAVRASASLPLLSRPVEIGGRLYLDGGCSDSIPIIKSLKDGNKKNVVIMTKQVGYRRQPSSQIGAVKLYYHKYPEFVKSMIRRHVTYNRTLDFIEEHEKKGHIFLFRPQYDSGVARIEKDGKKLRALYEMGYEDAKERFDELMEYLG